MNNRRPTNRELAQTVAALLDCIEHLCGHAPDVSPQQAADISGQFIRGYARAHGLEQTVARVLTWVPDMLLDQDHEARDILDRAFH